MGWTGTSGNDVYYDYTGVNDMNGGDGNDQLYGLGGNDVFHVTGNVLSFPGFDYFNGGTGYNTITVDTSYTNIYLTSLAASDNINEIDGFANLAKIFTSAASEQQGHSSSPIGPTAFGTATSHIGLDGGTSLFGSAVNWISSS
jgi:hypothetical protein